ncbi:MAG TPA: hypothetical protein VNH11_23605 [Pirellulales bacterium]|nr:hypothetical protein [Pirellulales bacterium]
MQSSAMVAFRTVIMITCLVAVPLAALTGTAVTKVVKTALGDRGASSPSGEVGGSEGPFGRPPLAAAEEPEHAPRVVAPAAGGATKVAQASPLLPRARITAVRAVADAPEVAGGRPAEAAIETAPLWNAPPRTASTPRNRDMTAHFAPSRVSASLPSERQARGGRPKALHKTVYSQPDEDAATEAAPAAKTVGGDLELVPIEQAMTDNRFADSERRLRELGAIYYRLETWGDGGHFYRCSCSIAAAPRSRATRHFEAIDAAPSQAIQAVIAQVQAWRDKSASR